MKQKVRYKSSGKVLGNLWGGGVGSYGATPLEAPLKKDILRIAKKALIDKSLDSGMGFESLKGAVLFITVITTYIIQDKEFKNETNLEPIFIGNLTDDEKNFLLFN